jgi:hypothetical protein
MIEPIKLPTQCCPVCEATITATTGADMHASLRPAPRAGDVTVCIHCASANVFMEGGIIRRATEGEREAFSRNPEVQTVVSTIRAMHAGEN